MLNIRIGKERQDLEMQVCLSQEIEECACIPRQEIKKN